MHDASAAGERAEKADHKIDSVVGGENAEVTHARPKWIENSERYTLLEIIFVGHHAAFGAAAGSGRIDDGRDVLAFAGHESGRDAASKLFPALGASEIGVGRRFGDEDGLNVKSSGTARSGAKLSPDGVLGDQDSCARVLQKLPLFGGREFVIERNEDAARIKNGEGGDQPLGLIGHDDAGAVARGETCVLCGSRERNGSCVKFAIGEAFFFAFAVGFDQTDFIRETLHGVPQGSSDGGIVGEIQHAKSGFARESQRIQNSDYRIIEYESFDSLME